MGTRSHRFGTVSEAGDLRFAADGAGILALGTGRALPKDLLTTLADVRPQSRAIDCGLRFPGRGDSPIPPALHSRGDGSRNTEDLALQRNRTPERIMDVATVSRSDSR